MVLKSFGCLETSFSVKTNLPDAIGCARKAQVGREIVFHGRGLDIKNATNIFVLQ
jgi:hypothetical protein